MSDHSLSLFERRAWNIACRTAHIATTGALLGGHVFGAAASSLRPWLYAAIATGAILVLLEAYSGLRWLHQARGILVLVKLALLLAIPFAWHMRVPILFAVVVLASVGSHMPARYRYYSVVAREVLK
ncbi:MAG: hypothetical protein ACE148_12275 [Vicinamibacterales bacterium]